MDTYEQILERYKDSVTMLNLIDLSKLLKVRSGTISRWINSKKPPYIPFIEIGKHKRFILEDVLNFIKSRNGTSPLDADVVCEPTEGDNEQ